MVVTPILSSKKNWFICGREKKDITTTPIQKGPDIEDSFSYTDLKSVI